MRFWQVTYNNLCMTHALSARMIKGRVDILIAPILFPSLDLKFLEPWENNILDILNTWVCLNNLGRTVCLFDLQVHIMLHVKEAPQ